MKNKLLITLSVLLATVFVGVFLCGLLIKPSVPAEAPTETTATPAVATTATEAPEQKISLSFIGDCIICSESTSNRQGNFNWYAENETPDYFFKQVQPVLAQDDFTIANVECVISDGELEKTKKDYDPAYWFKAKEDYTKILTAGSVEIASLVNNHTGDYGDEGYTDTLTALESAGIQTGEDCVPVYFEKNNVKVGLVCAHLWGYDHVRYIKDALNEMEGKCDYRIVLFHGGEEGKHNPDNYKIDACRELANEGLCDLIVGSHPHVLQPMEVVNNVPILYSLGNFCFGGNNYPENKTVILGVEIEKDNSGKVTATTNLVPCYVFTGESNNWQPAIITDENDKNEILQMLSTPVEHVYETTTTTSAPTSSANTETQAQPMQEQTDSAEDEAYDSLQNEIPTVIAEY